MRVTGFDKAKVSADPSDCAMISPPRRNTVGERGAARTYSAKSSAEDGKARQILENIEVTIAGGGSCLEVVEGAVI